MTRDIVVIGASAGGVSALQQLVAGLPASFTGSVFIVLHVAPHTPSILHKLLSRAGPLPAFPAEDGAPIQPGVIRVATADHHLLLEPDRMRVSRGPRENWARPAVDVLFRSAAHAFGSRVVGVVLTGSLDDGTAGLWAVKDRGGAAVVQALDDAQYPSMPSSALRHVAVDRVEPISTMASAILWMCNERVAPDEQAKEGKVARLDRMNAEIDFARGKDALAEGGMELGPIVSNTCPECHGSLFELRDGSIVRFRCHTGHAYSLETLFAQAEEELDKTLWSTLRALDERLVMLQQLKRQADDLNDAEDNRHYAEQLIASHEWRRRIHDIVLEVGLSARDRIPPDRNASGAQG